MREIFNIVLTVVLSTNAILDAFVLLDKESYILLKEEFLWLIEKDVECRMKHHIELHMKSFFKNYIKYNLIIKVEQNNKYIIEHCIWKTKNAILKKRLNYVKKKKEEGYRAISLAKYPE